MTTLQIAFVIFIVGVLVGMALAYLVRPYDFKAPESEQDDSVNESKS